jgi:hypothetical protein
MTVLIFFVCFPKNYDGAIAHWTRREIVPFADSVAQKKRQPSPNFRKDGETAMSYKLSQAHFEMLTKIPNLTKCSQAHFEAGW